MNGWFGPWELLIVLAVVLLIFGPKRLPSLGRSLGQGARSFKEAITGRHKDAEERSRSRRCLRPRPTPSPRAKQSAKPRRSS